MQNTDTVAQPTKKVLLTTSITTAVQRVVSTVLVYACGDLELEWRTFPEDVRAAIVAKSRTKEMGEES